MIGASSSLVEWAAFLCVGLLVVGMGFALVRIIRGPSLPDRVVGLDMLTVLMVAFAAAFAVAADEPAFVDVAIALALVGFLGTVAFARYAERRTSTKGQSVNSREGSTWPTS